MIQFNELHADALSTASFVEQVDTMFDVLNSRRRRADKPARCAISSGGDSWNTLVTLREWVAKWEFIGARSQSQIKCHQGLMASLHSIHALCSELLHDGFAFVCTSRFNQDCLENFFATLRGKQRRNENPSPAQFHTAFRSAIVLSSLDSSSNNKNCVDDDFARLSVENVVLTSEAATENTSSRPSDVVDTCLINDDDMWSDVTSEILHSDICYEQGVIETFTEAKESLIAYLSSWLARKCGICSRCQDV